MTTDNTIISAPLGYTGITSINYNPAPVLRFSADGKEPMLEIKKDGFYVRGVRVNQDEKEAETVYNAFHQWLTYTILTK